MDPVQAYYARDGERDRLGTGVGRVEFLRTTEVVARTLPPPPAVVADVGGGPGRYTAWLLDRGYDVIHRDIVPDHVDQIRARYPTGSKLGDRLDAAVGDARQLDVDDDSVDAVLLLGPLYHLIEAADRRQALTEARRVVRPGGSIHAAAISRWATRLDGVLIGRIDDPHPQVLTLIDEVEATGVLPPVFEGSFTAYLHTPAQLRDELLAAGLVVEQVVSVESVAFALSDLDARLDDPDERRRLLDALRAVESVPDLLGVGPHLLAATRRP